MKKSEQKQFIRSLTKSIVGDIEKKISAGKIPENWDGHELRYLLSEKFESEAWTLNKKHRRYKDYKNTVLINNL